MKRRIYLTTTAVAGGVALAGALGAAPLHAQSASELRQQVFALEQRIDALESQETAMTSSTGASFSFSGYVKLDATYDLRQGVDADDLFQPDGLVPGARSDGGFNAHARETRLTFDFSNDTSRGPVNARIEFDLFGTRGNELISNSHHPRLRHAFVEWNGWTVGQTWSNFMPLASLAPTVDFAGPTGIVFIRQAQVRYTQEVAPNFTVAASLENSEFTGRNAAGLVGSGQGAGFGSGVNADIDRVPDFVLTGTWQEGDTHLRASGVVRQLRTPRELRRPGQGGTNFSDTGYGVSLSGGTSLWQGGTVGAQLNFGDGIGRYIISGVGNDAYVNPNGNLDTVEAIGGSLGVTQQINDQLRAAVSYGHYEASDTFQPNDTKRLRTIHAGAFYDVTEDVTLMGEVIWGDRRQANGRTADASRIQTAVQFNF